MIRYRLARGVRVTWVGSEIHIVSGTDTDREITVQGDTVLRLLDRFSTPKTLEEAARSFEDLEADDLRGAVDALVAAQVLVPADAPRIEPLVASDFAQVVDAGAHRERIRARLKTIPGVRLDDGGMTVTNCGKDAISPGCISCKEGRWLCVFPSFECNADCSFCPQTRTEKKAPAMPTEEILALIEARAADLTGVSVSGGELFLNLPAAKRIIELVKRRFPHIYTWAYTNGMAATVDEMKALAALGLDELRFDLAATGFSKSIMDKTELAAREIFPWVTVEVPAYEITRRELVDHDKLQELERIGVKLLNLGEVTILSPDSPSFDAFKGHAVYEPEALAGSYCLASSRDVTLDILEHAARVGCKMPINDCSSEAKLLQTVSAHIILGAPGG